MLHLTGGARGSLAESGVITNKPTIPRLKKIIPKYLEKR
jgi:hypothetical protein